MGALVSVCHGIINKGHWHAQYQPIQTIKPCCYTGEP